MRILVLALIVTFSASAESRRSKIWKWSLAAVVAAQTADAASSVGQYEGNPMLGSRFGWRGGGVKAGIVLGTVAGQILLRRRHPEAVKAFAVANFVSAAALGGIAVRNWRVARE